MYVCICKALTENDVRRAVANGCNTVRELSRSTGLGSECGRCTVCAKGVLQSCQSSCSRQMSAAPSFAAAA